MADIKQTVKDLAKKVLESMPVPKPIPQPLPTGALGVRAEGKVDEPAHGGYKHSSPAKPL